jgi:hypothetical protein
MIIELITTAIIIIITIAIIIGIKESAANVALL